MPISTSPAKKSMFQLLLPTLPWLRDYQYRIALVLLLLIFANVLTIAMPIVFKEIIDSFDATVTQNPLLVLPLALLLIYGGLKISQAILWGIKHFFIVQIEAEIQQRLSINVFEHLHKLSLRYHLERKTGGVIEDMQRGSSAMMALISSALFIILPFLVEFILAMVLLMSQYMISLTLIVLATVITFAVYMYFASQWHLDTREAMNKQGSEKNNIVSDSLLNYETVKYFNNEQREATYYKEVWGKWATLFVKNHITFAFIYVGQKIIIAFGVTLILIVASQSVITKEMTVGDLVLINALFIQLTVPMSMLGIQIRHFKHSVVDMKQVVDLLNISPEVNDANYASSLVYQQAEISFQQVDFSYDGQRTILKDFSLTIPANKTVAIVGQSGAGKSTLTRLLFRFYDVQKGRICIDGQDIRHVTQHSLREVMAIVPQETVLFNNSIAFNLAYGNPNATQADIEQAAKMAHIYDFIESLPEKWQTKVGERGLKLSGGEKQRVAIARAILKQPKILLLDEATSSLDSKTEKGIQKTLETITSDYTTLIIAHRLSSIIHADLIVVMKQGCIVEQGQHQALLGQQGLYAEMWQTQVMRTDD